MIYSLNEAANREAFERAPLAYCDRFREESPYREAVLNIDFLGILRPDANIYYLATIRAR